MIENLFDWSEAHARTTDPQTSHDAAQSIEGDPATRIEKIILNALENSIDGLTTHEIVDATGIAYATVTPRLKPMRKKGLAVDSGVTRPSPTGRQCIVWKNK